MSHRWHTTAAVFIRVSCMYLEGCSLVEVLEAKLAVMLFTSSTLNMSCGTNQSWKGTVLFPGLGQCAISDHILLQAFLAFGQK